MSDLAANGTQTVVLLRALNSPNGTGYWAPDERAGFEPAVARDLISRGVARALTPDEQRATAEPRAHHGPGSLDGGGRARAARRRGSRARRRRPCGATTTPSPGATASASLTSESRSPWPTPSQAPKPRSQKACARFW